MKSGPNQKKKNAIQLERSASPGARWDIHADVIHRIQSHVDTKVPLRPKPGGAGGTAQLWQKMAMDRIAVMLTELTSKTSAIIDQFNRNPRSFDMDSFIEYLDESADNATRLADQIASFSDFGKSNGRIEAHAERSAGGLERRKRTK
jgi:hypothetical protein